MEIDLKDFLPIYPSIEEDEDFDARILRKKEFDELRFDKSKVGKDIFLNYQKLVARFLSSYTPYDELLLFHEMGTGKTCTVIGTIENLRYEPDSFIDGAVVLAKSDNILNNFISEYFYRCTEGKYTVEDDRAMRRELTKFYKFDTFEKFAKHVASTSDAALKRLYENKVIVLDEIQNIRDHGAAATLSSIPVYKSIHRLLHLLTRRKIILMSGTPMKDSVDEFADVMNLILPLNDAFPIRDEFVARYFDDTTHKLTRHVDEFKRKIRGRISYLKGDKASVPRVFMGDRHVGNLRHFTLFMTTMHELQAKAYDSAYARDIAGRGIFSNSRQAILAVYPDGSYGQDGYTKYISNDDGSSLLRAHLRRYGDDVSSMLRALNELSCKYAYVVRRLLDSGNKSFIYTEFVNGSGAIYLAVILDAFNFAMADGYEKTSSRRYALINNQTSTSKDIKRIVARFNDARDNVDGSVIQVLIGSRLIIEGFTLNDIVDEHILTPHWNYAETSQAIARGWRYGSHDASLRRRGGGGGADDVKVYVFQHASDGVDESIDIRMYEISEEKDLLVKQIEYVVKISNWDCALNKSRNFVTSAVDGARECEYEKCDYECDSSLAVNVFDDSTYNLYYGKNDEIRQQLREFFRDQKWASLQIDVLPMFENKYDAFEIFNTVALMIRDDDIIKDRFNFDRCLRFCGDILYATTDLRHFDDDVNVLYYQLNRFVYGGGGQSLNALVDAITDHVYDKLKASITDYPASMAVRTLSELDMKTQRRILADFVLETETTNEAVKRILDAYDKFYGIVDDGIVVWMHSDQLGAKALRYEGADWFEVDFTPPKTSSKFSSDVKFYGQVNPSNDEFCLRDLRDASAPGSDLRRIKVGKRCRDWDFLNLIEVVVFHLHLEPPSTSEEEYSFDDAVTKYGRFFDRFPSIRREDMTPEERRSFAYWVNKDRRTICENVRRELYTRNLIEDNLECGGQKKRRLKYE